MNIFDAHISGSLSVSSSAEISNNLLISGNLTVLGTISGSISGSITNADTANRLANKEVTEFATTGSNSFNGNQTVTGSIIATQISSSFTGSGTGLYGIPASGITGLNLSQIAEGSSTASISSTNGLRVNTNTEITGALTATGQISGSFKGDGTNLYNIPASGVTGLNLTRIADGNTTASISSVNGLRINTNTEITGALKINKVNLGNSNIVSSTVTDSNGKYFIDGVRNPKLNFVKGLIYRFYNDNNGTHPFEFSTTNDGTHNGGVAYTQGVTTNPSPYYIQIEVAQDAPDTLYYFCDHHTGMGNSITTYSDALNSLADSSLISIEMSRIATTGSNTFIGNQNISGSLGVTGSVDITGSITLNGQPIGTGKLDEVTFNSYTSSNNSTNTTQNSKLSSIETTTGSLNTFSSSINDTIKTKLNTETVVSGSSQILITGTTGFSTFSSSISTSIDELSSSTNNLSSSIALTTSNLSSSLTSINNTQNNRLSSIESASSSLNTFTSSINTTIKDKMNADGVLSGSITFDISVIPGFSGLTNSVSSSISSSVNELSGSLTLTVTNLSSSLTNTDENQNGRITSLESASGSLNTFTSSINTTIKNKLNTEGVVSGSIQVDLTQATGYSTFSSSIASVNSSQDSRLTTIESRYATTGSNQFNGSQSITGSLTITQNLTVLGSSSIVYASSSQLMVEDNVIVVNASTPAERFAGLQVYDSGSNGSITASLFWDGQNNRWIYQNSSEAHYGGALLIAGPRNTGSLGDEITLTSGKLPKSIGGDHIGDSIMNETDGVIYVTGSVSATGTVYGTNITSIESSTSSLNTFTSSLQSAIELTGSNLTIKGNLLVKGTTTNVNTTTLDVDNNLINLNGNGASFAGLKVKDTTGPTQVSGSLLWDATNDYWIAGQLGSEQRIVRETEFSSAVTRIGSIETSTGSLNSFTSSINTTIKSKINSDTVHSGSYLGTATTANLSENASYLYYTDARVKTKLNAEGVISGSAQIDGSLLGSNKTITIGSTSTTLGGTSTSLAGLTSVTSTAFTGSIQGYATSETLSTVTSRGSSTSNALTINNSNGGLNLNRPATSNYVGLYYQTAGSSKWFIGLRENLTSNNYICYSETLGADVLTLNQTTGVATFGYNITAANFSGSSSGTNTGDETLARINALAITAVGTITGGTWNGSSIGTTYTAAKVTAVNAGTGVGVDTTTGSVTVSIGQSVATTATPTFGSTTINGNLIVTGVTYSANATVQGAGAYDWFYVGRGTSASALWIKDISGAGWALMGGSYSLAFKKDVSGTSWANALSLTATGASDASPNVSITNNLSVGGTITSGTWNGSSISTTYTAAKVTAVNAGTGVGVDTTTGSVTVSIGQSVATSAVPTFKALVLTSDTDSRVLKLRELGTTSGNIIQFQDSAGNNKWELVGRSNTDATPFYIYKNDGTNNGYIFSISGGGIPNFHTALTIGGSTAKSFSNSSYSTTFSSVTSVTVTHNLGTKDVAVFVYDSSDNMFWPSAIVTTSTSVVTVTFASSRSGRVVVVR